MKEVISEKLYSYIKNYKGDIMGRRQTMQEKFKQQMKAYRKKKMKIDNTPLGQ